MARLYFPEWMTIISTVVMVFLILFGVFVTGFNKILIYLLSITILLGMYIFTYVFSFHLMEYGEKDLEEDVEVLKLEKEHSTLLWVFANGIGIAFLIPGLPKISENPLMGIIGLLMLIIGNLIYSYFYYPRYIRLLIKRKVEICLNKKRSKKK